jgi:hypothetical protein
MVCQENVFLNGVNSRRGRPTASKSDENVEKVRTLVWNDRHLTVRMIAEGRNISRLYNWFWRKIWEWRKFEQRCRGGWKFALNFCNESRIMTNVWTESSLGIKVGVYRINWRQSGCACYGSLQVHPVPRKRGCQNLVKSVELFLRLQRGFAPTFCPTRSVLPTRSFISKFWNVIDIGFIA